MQPMLKKTRRPARNRAFLLLAAALVLAALLALGVLLRDKEEPPVEGVTETALTLYEYAPEDVTSLTITRSGEMPWTVTRGEDGLFLLNGRQPLSEAKTAKLANAACILTCEDVLTEDPAEYADHLADFGLEAPDYIAEITYADGTAVTMRVGLSPVHMSAWRYMTIDGDDRLFTIGRGLVEELFVSAASLREVTQPVLHKARIDQLTLTGGDGTTLAQWTLDAAITDADAIDRWQITAPFTYPADATAMEGLLENAAALRLGTYLAPATPENLTAYGFDTPRLVLRIHMAAGTIATTGMDGAVSGVNYPEETCTFTIGGEESDLILYVRHGDSLYRCSSFSMGVFLDVDLHATMSRYLLPVALGNLASLTIETEDTSDAYTLTRTERVADNNDLVYDEEGNVVWDVTVTQNGSPLDYATFEAAYRQLTSLTVSGVLPEGQRALSAPHTTWTFTDTNGTVRTVAFADFDALHDSVIVDGHEAFYLIKGGFRLVLE